MAVLQPAYLIHLQQHAPETYDGTLELLLGDLREVKRILEEA